MLDREELPVPPLLHQESPAYLGSADIPIARYTSREFHDLEVEKVWKRAWQMICLEADIPNAGDISVYEIAGLSVLVVRTEGGQIKAYPNSCLHRGALLRTEDGNSPELACPFHGFCWGLDGALRHLPTPWDFPHVDPDRFQLPELSVGCWEGFVFVSMDPHAPGLHDSLGQMVDHVASIARPPLRDRFKAVHIAKPMRCNWKVALEAFIESFHVTTTHPQALPWGGDINTQYDIYPGQELWNRMITLAAVPSPVLGDDVDQQDIADTLYNDLIGGPGSISVPEGGTARQAVAQAFRSMLRETMGVDVSGVTDCQVLDTIEYFFFPNFVTFIGVLQSLTYRFRPLGNDPDMSIMEIMLLAPLPEGAPRPPAAPVHWLGIDDLWTDAPELGNFAPFLNQDLSNVNRVQRGLHSASKTGVTLADYQEVRIRHFHQMLDDYINSDSCQE